MELQDYLRALRKRWLTVLVTAIIAVAIAAAAAVSMTPIYQAQTELFVAPEAAGTTAELVQGSEFIQNRVKSYEYVIESESVLQPVIDQLGLSTTVGELAGRVSATVPTDTVVLVITVTDQSAESAAAIANAVATQFQAVATQLEPSRPDGTSVVTISVVQPSVVPESPVSPDLKLYLGLGVLVGLGLGFTLAVIRQLADKRIRRESDIRSLIDVPVVGHLPEDKATAKSPRLVEQGAQGARAEAFRQLRTNLQFLDVGAGRRSFVVTSSVAGEGKTSTSVSLALTLADAGLSVCLVEGDLRRPTVSHFLDLEGASGLTNVLIGQLTLDEAIQSWGDSSLDVVMSGAIPPNPSELLASPAMERVVRELERRYDVVVIDSPPLLSVTDAAILARRCAGALLVVNCGKGATTRSHVVRSVEDLAAVDARILGVVLNRLPVKGPDALPIAVYSYRIDNTGGFRAGGFKPAQPASAKHVATEHDADPPKQTGPPSDAERQPHESSPSARDSSTARRAGLNRPPTDDTLPKVNGEMEDRRGSAPFSPRPTPH